jgi:Uma2 family endonuclease
MSITTTSMFPADGKLPARSDVLVQDQIAIPGWINDLESYRRWAHSDGYPDQGWVSFLNGHIWVDFSMEEFLTHNRVKGAYAFAVMGVLRAHPIGDFVHDRMLLSNPAANLSTEPDGLFYLWETMRTGRLRLVPGKREGYMELEGTPDGVLEVVSQTSERKDKVVLRELYWSAGVPEYWLVDARTDPPQFDILRHTPTGYVPTIATEGWLRSEILGREFRLLRQVDPLGHPQFVVEAR